MNINMNVKNSKNNSTETELRFKRINNSIHWFKIIGGVFLVFGFIGLLKFVIMTSIYAIDGVLDFSDSFAELTGIVFTIIFGWCFLQVAECMKAIDYLFKETEDIV